MQPGHIYRAHGAWHLRYRVKRKQVSVRLADHNDQYRTKGSVRLLAESYLQPVNAGRQVDGPMTLQLYAETVYFPSIKPPKKSPSTCKATSISTPSRFNRASVGCVCLRPRPPTCNPFCIELTKRKRTVAPIVPQHQLVAVCDLHPRAEKRNASRPKPNGRCRDSRR